MHLALIHASPAAIAPLIRYYSEFEPGWRLTNLLDDALLYLFREPGQPGVVQALASLVERGAAYGARAALITCSAVPLALLERLEALAPIPLVKIDVPMARAAVMQANRIGVLASFAPAVESMKSLLAESAALMGRRVEIVPQLCANAYTALLGGDAVSHDQLLQAAAQQFVPQNNIEAVVLAQVSMAHLRAGLARHLRVPVFSSLESSHAAVRQVLGL
jgi:Asp/Glu/hydantoin racemase